MQFMDEALSSEKEFAQSNYYLIKINELKQSMVDHVVVQDWASLSATDFECRDLLDEITDSLLPVAVLQQLESPLQQLLLCYQDAIESCRNAKRGALADGVQNQRQKQAALSYLGQ